MESRAPVPRISIVTPVFNGAATLERMFRSIARQQIGDWEHLVVDDGSTDATAEIVSARARGDPRIRLIEQANAGASAARNRGLAEARGQWVLFLDADDTVHPRYFDRMLRRAGPDVDAVCCGFVRRDAAGHITARYKAPRLDTDPFRVTAGNPPTAIHAILARRELILEVGGFDPKLATNEDWDLWLRIARSGARFAVERALLADYRNSDDSLTSNGVRMLRDAKCVMKRMRERDPRVPHPLPQYAEGYAPSDLGLGVLTYALWSGGFDIAAGGDGLALVAELHHPVEVPIERHRLTGALLDGLVVRGGARRRDLLPRWHELGPRVERFLSAVAAAAASPGLDFAILREIEWEIVRNGRIERPVTVGATYAAPLIEALVRGCTPPAECDVILLKAPLRPRSLFLYGAPALRPLPPAAVRDLVWSQTVRRLVARAQDVRPQRAIGWLMYLSASGRRALSRIVGAGKGRRAAAPNPPAAEPPPGGDSAAWDAFFEREDPWNYGSAYEQLKYQQTLELLPAGARIGAAIELACAEGMFTRMLAPKVERLCATDISAKALARAAARVRAAGLSNVEFQTLDFFSQPLGGPWDLIVASEVLYYMGGFRQLSAFVEKVEAALAPGGWFLHAHAYEVTDEPDHVGLDCGHPFGAQTISRAFRSAPGLKRVKALTTPLYLVELYERVGPSATHDDGEVIEAPIASELDPAVAAYVVWNGAVKTRRQAASEQRAFHIPVLMYHRVADAGPEPLSDWRTTSRDFEHQLRFLRRRGFRSVSVDEWDEAQVRSACFRGRPILITFDDGYLDFYETAWPILERNGFTAHVFVVTGKVGAAAEWDSHLAEPAPLMTWRQIVELHAAGVSFGSHLETHRAADGLPTRELLGEAARSRCELEDRLGVSVRTLAPPFGATDARVEQICAAAGYDRLFRAGGGMARVWGPRMRIPRIEVAGYDDIRSFAAKLGQMAEPPEPADEP